MANAAPTPSYPPPRPRFAGLLFALLLLVVLVFGPHLAENIQYALTRGELRAKAEQATAELDELGKKAELVKLSDTSRAFRLVAERVEPSVVHIDTEQVGKAQPASVFDEFFGIPRGSYREIGQGSGVIVDSKEGYILTNYHVIQNASRIEVGLSDGRVIDDVTVIGSDVLTDLAVLKINAERLIGAEFGDSKALEVGDWVLAVGNPYGLDRTVTCGIVSAKQRRALAENTAYQDFLQTDAAVNPGNSGGPLVNISGKVVGITTAIVGKAYQGISFAIPTHIATDVYKQLISRGGVARGYLGVGLQELTPEIARQLHLGHVEGVLVTGVQPGSPADKAGLEPGDVITEWNGERVRETSELRLLVAGSKIGAKVSIKVVRDGKTHEFPVTITERKDGGG